MTKSQTEVYQQSSTCGGDNIITPADQTMPRKRAAARTLLEHVLLCRYHPQTVPKTVQKSEAWDKQNKLHELTENSEDTDLSRNRLFGAVGLVFAARYEN